MTIADLATMQINVNGETQTLPDNCTLSDLLRRLELNEGRLAVEVNRDVIPRSEHAGHRLHDGDRVEIVHAIGGG